MTKDAISTPIHEAPLLAMQAVERHVKSEYTWDLDLVVGTVCKDARYAMMIKPGTIDVINGEAGVRAFYERVLKNFHLLRTVHVLQIVTDWYVLFESRPLRLDVNTNQVIKKKTIVLFPVANDRIVGEFIWDADSQGLWREKHSKPGDQDIDETDACRVIDRWENALRSRNYEVAAGLLTDDCVWIGRDYFDAAGPLVELLGVERILGHFKAWDAAVEIESYAIAQRSSSTWYGFLEEAQRVRLKKPVAGFKAGGTALTRTATIMGLTPTGKIEGFISYGAPMTAGGSIPDPGCGRISWSRPGYEL